MLRPGDTLIIKEFDRLGRNKSQVKKELEYFKENGVLVRILNIPTSLMSVNQDNKWIMDMVNNIIIEVLAATAEEELSKIKMRQKEGIAAAKKQGKHMGRSRVPIPDGFSEEVGKWQDKDITARECMRRLGLKPSTFYRLVSQSGKPR